MVLSPAASVTVHRLPATPSTVHWDYVDLRLEPVSARDAPDLLSDPGSTGVFGRRQRVYGRIDKRCFPRWIGIPA